MSMCDIVKVEEPGLMAATAAWGLAGAMAWAMAGVMVVGVVAGIKVASVVAGVEMAVLMAGVVVNGALSFHQNCW